MRKLIFILLITFNLYAQDKPPSRPPGLSGVVEDVGIKINTVKEGYYKVFIEDSLVSKHNSETEAVQEVINQKFKNFKSNVRVEFPELIRVDFEGNLLTDAREIDTLYLQRMQSNGWLDYTDGGLHPLDTPIVYLPFKGIGMLRIEPTPDPPNWQKIFALKQTKTFGKVSYENLDIPFQLVHDSLVSVSSDKIVYRTFANKKYCVDYYIDNVLYKENVSCNPGQTVLYQENVWRHTNTFRDLLPNTEYIIRIECREVDGNGFDFVEFKLSTNGS